MKRTVERRWRWRVLARRRQRFCKHGDGRAYGGIFRYISKGVSQLQRLETTFVDFDSAMNEEVLASIRPKARPPSHSPWFPCINFFSANLGRNPHKPYLPPSPNRTHFLPNPHPPRRFRPFPSHPLHLPLRLLRPALAASVFADLTVHSITKYINGHSDVLMGALLQSTHGAVPGVFDAWLALRGAETLLRLKDVIYPALVEPQGHNNDAKILAPHACKFVDDKGDFPFGGMVSFRIGRAGELADEGASEILLTRTGLFTLVESLGGVESLAELPEKMTHGSIPPAERLALGITPDLVHLTVGVEDIDDLIADVEQALSWAVEGWNSTSTRVASSDSE
ncbi:hypothetical protein M422DRAFT_249523 [Sphaerobolus stellatus SS14]|uniref:cystathionine gamma-lyase n=1 Tax=Sphaerobolus stellatus (strain SS14) TaxID=990650 RepID=A0A0C9UUP2_SPHS4|nr:hypothetical protein M422DRAFT_249523 [Sphaerobolus stellatus SS14]